MNWRVFVGVEDLQRILFSISPTGVLNLAHKRATSAARFNQLRSLFQRRKVSDRLRVGSLGGGDWMDVPLRSRVRR